MCGCIPSLHPIFTLENRVIDDRIVGIWMDEEDYNNKSQFAKKWDFQRFTNFEYRYKDLEKFKINVSNFEIDTNIHNKLNYKLHSQKQEEYYILNYQGSNSPFKYIPRLSEKMIVNLTKINGELYADFYPWLPKDKSPYAAVKSTRQQSIFSMDIPRFQSNLIYGHTFAKLTFDNSNLIIKPFDPDQFERLIKEQKIRLKHEIVNEEIVITASTQELRSFISKYGNREDLFMEGDILRLSQETE